MATMAVGCSHVSGLLVQPLFTTAGPDVVREVGPDHIHGLDTRDPKKVLPPRRPTDQHHAISTSATRDALWRVPLHLSLIRATRAVTGRRWSLSSRTIAVSSANPSRPLAATMPNSLRCPRAALMSCVR